MMHAQAMIKEWFTNVYFFINMNSIYKITTLKYQLKMHRTCMTSLCCSWHTGLTWRHGLLNTMYIFVMYVSPINFSMNNPFHVSCTHAKLSINRSMIEVRPRQIEIMLSVCVRVGFRVLSLIKNECVGEMFLYSSVPGFRKNVTIL